MLIRAITIMAAATLSLGAVAISDTEARSRNAPSAAAAKGVVKTPAGTSAVRNGATASRRGPSGRIANNGTHLDGLRAGFPGATVDAVVLPTGATVMLR